MIRLHKFQLIGLAILLSGCSASSARWSRWLPGKPQGAEQVSQYQPQPKVAAAEIEQAPKRLPGAIELPFIEPPSATLPSGATQPADNQPSVIFASNPGVLTP